MRMRTPAARRAITLPLIAALATTFVPLEIAPAEAGRIRFHVRSGVSSKHVDRVDDSVQARSPRRIRIRSGSDSSSSSGTSSGQDRDLKAGARPPGAAAAAAARARAALEAEKAALGTSPSAVGYQPVPIGKTTDYSNGVMCVAGC